MVKMILKATSNDGARYKYDFEKKEDFVEPFVSFMLNLGFDKDEIEDYFSPYDPQIGNNKRLKLADVTEEIWNFKNKDYDVDLFFTKDKIIMIVRINKNSKQKKLTESIDKFSIFKT